MCWHMRKTPARFPNCQGRSQRNCINFDPDEDYIKWCIPAEQRGNQCETTIPTTQTSSTKRGINCPRHRTKPNPTSEEGSGGDNSGGGGDGLVSGQDVKVEA